MKYPRSFHTFSFNETMRALLAIGGENNNSCEFYDFYHWAALLRSVSGKAILWNEFP